MDADEDDAGVPLEEDIKKEPLEEDPAEDDPDIKIGEDTSLSDDDDEEVPLEVEIKKDPVNPIIVVPTGKRCKHAETSRDCPIQATHCAKCPQCVWITGKGGCLKPGQHGSRIKDRSKTKRSKKQFK